MYNYQYIKLLDGTIVDDQIRRLPDNAIVPFDPANTDYAEYLKWVEAGNTPLPADEQGTQA